MTPFAFDALVHLEEPVRPFTVPTDVLSDEQWERRVKIHLENLQKSNTKVLNAGTHPQERRWHRLRELSADLSGENPLLFAQGLHPWWVADDVEKLLLLVEAQLPNCVAIGECGLDKNARAPKEIQEKAFVRQLELGTFHRLPVIAHVVGWHGLATECIRKSGAKGVVHGFSGSPEILQVYLRLGWSVSIGMSVFTSLKAKEAAIAVPEDRLLIETDGAADLHRIAEEVGRLRGMSFGDALFVTTQNASRLFQF